MKTKNTFMISSVEMKHITGTKVKTSGSEKNCVDRSGDKDTLCIVIFLKGILTSGKELLVKALNKNKSEFENDTAFPYGCIFFKGRDLYMRTGETPGWFRDSSGSSVESPASDRRISGVFRGYSELVRGLYILAGRISGLLRSSPDKPGNLSGSYRAFPGSQNKSPETLRRFPEWFGDLSGSDISLSVLFRRFPGLLGGISEESGERPKA